VNAMTERTVGSLLRERVQEDILKNQTLLTFRRLKNTNAEYVMYHDKIPSLLDILEIYDMLEINPASLFSYIADAYQECKNTVKYPRA